MNEKKFRQYIRESIRKFLTEDEAEDDYYRHIGGEGPDNIYYDKKHGNDYRQQQADARKRAGVIQGAFKYKVDAYNLDTPIGSWTVTSRPSSPNPRIDAIAQAKRKISPDRLRDVTRWSAERID